MKAEITTFGQREDQIVELLIMPGVDVSILPTEAELNRPRPTAVPQLFVIINGSTFDDPGTLGEPTAQSETIQGEIFIRANKRRGPLGIFDLYDKVSERLLGRKLPGTILPITFTQFGYVAGIQNNWQYALTFSFATYRVGKCESDAAPFIKQINHEINLKDE